MNKLHGLIYGSLLLTDNLHDGRNLDKEYSKTLDLIVPDIKGTEPTVSVLKERYLEALPHLKPAQSFAVDNDVVDYNMLYFPLLANLTTLTSVKFAIVLGQLIKANPTKQASIAFYIYLLNKILSSEDTLSVHEYLSNSYDATKSFIKNFFKEPSMKSTDSVIGQRYLEHIHMMVGYADTVLDDSVVFEEMSKYPKQSIKNHVFSDMILKVLYYFARHQGDLSGYIEIPYMKNTPNFIENAFMGALVGAYLGHEQISQIPLSEHNFKIFEELKLQLNNLV